MRIEGEFTDQLKEEAFIKEASEEFARRWFTASNEHLLQKGDEYGYEVYPVVQAAQPPRWTGDAWVFTYPHRASGYFEYGVEEHEIEANNAEVLAFEWPDAPPDIREMFSDTFPTVFFPKVTHPGIPALAFVRNGRAEVKQDMEAL